MAVERAREWAGNERCRFEVMDGAAWPGASGIQLILAEECLYHLLGSELRRFRKPCQASLSADGAMRTTFARAGRHPRAEAACGLVFPEIDTIDDPTGGRHLVLRPGSGVRID